MSDGAVQLLARLRVLDVKVWAEGELLRVSAPTGVLTPALRDQLAARKSELLALLQASGGIAAEAQGRAESGTFPLSFAQQRLWFLDQLHPGTAAYTISGGIRLSGALDVSALERAIAEIVRRHATLRTTFAMEGDQPVQVVHPPAPRALEVVDLASLSIEAREARLAALVGDEAVRPLDLTRSPLFRVRLLRLGADEHVLLATTHHIVSDGWSMGVFVRELDVLYGAFAAARPSSLPELSIQYTDYADWQRRHLQGETLDQQLAYWTRTLGGELPVLDLPADHARPAMPTFTGGVEPVQLPPRLVTGLRALVRQEQATLFMGLLAVFKILLHRYTGQRDILVGTPIANRTLLDTEALIGFFANTLVLRTDLSRAPSFRELLGRVRATALGAYEHQDVPFEKIVEALQPVRDMSRSPLFQVMFALQNTPAAPPGLAGLTMTPLMVHNGTAKTDLVLYLDEGPDDVQATLEYSRDLFDAATIRRLGAHYVTLVEAAVEDPDQPIDTLHILSPTERRQVLVDWNATRTDYPRDRCIHELFAVQARQCPNAVALIFESQTVTYGQLDARADRFARSLRALGVGPDVPVGVWMDRSIELIVALLGILKAGGAYVPLDLAAPRERLAFMLQDAGVALLLTQRARRAQLPAGGVRVLSLDGPTDEAMGGDPVVDSVNRIHPTADSLAYVMYTSGSTGQPKGVSVPHRAVVRLVQNTNYARLGPDETFLQLSPVSFDASTFEIWGSLLNGARLVLYPGQAPSLREFGDIVARHDVSTLWLTAGLFHRIVEHDVLSLKPVRQLLAGGDVLSVAHVQRALSALPQCRVINGYGPTENTTFSCYHPIVASEEIDRSVPIGRPIANTRAYVLDERLQPVPIGVAGELCVAGDGLARGYLNRPELTQARFVPAPFAEEPGRLYRTGDRVRHLADGTLQFLGRDDGQVKIRGYRVELGEVESALEKHPGVRQAVVVAVPGPAGDKRLVAYVVPDAQRAASVAELRAALGDALPGYMIPSAWAMLEALPLTENGKVDRAALPPADGAGAGEAVPKRPADEVERRLIEIWQTTLGVERIGPQDSFFELGGHSLLAVTLFAKIEEAFGIALPLATLFQAPRVEDQANLIRQGGPTTAHRSMVTIQPRGRRYPIFAVPGVGGNVLMLHDLVRHLGDDQPFYGLQSVGLQGEAEPLARMEDIAAHFVSEIRSVQPKGPYHLLGVCMGGAVAYEMAQQLVAAGQRVPLLVLLETWRPLPWHGITTLHLRRATVLRFALRRLVVYARTLWQLEPAERMEYVKARLAMLRGALVSRDPFRGDRSELYRARVAEANLRAFRTYAPRPYPGPIVVFCAEGRRALAALDRRQAWRDLVTRMDVYTVPGNDSGLMLVEPHVRILAGQLQTYLSAQPLAEGDRS